MLQAYRRASRGAPLATAFATCVAKGSASDAIARVGFVASVSFVWLVYLSYASHGARDPEQ